jgi:hypothetical protein
MNNMQQHTPIQPLPEPLPGIYQCVVPFKNEMRYLWKQGEKVEVLRYSAQYHTVMCKLPNQAQEFEMNADVILQKFQLITHHSHMKPSTNRQLHALLTQAGAMQHKQELVSGFTQGRTVHSSEMHQHEAEALIRFLRAHLQERQPAAATAANRADRMRKKILAICHTLGWYRRNAFTGELILKNGKPQLDFMRINAFCVARSKHHKTLNEHTAAELPLLVTSFEKLLKSDLQ